MTLPPNGETPKNPADEPEFVVPEAALPEEGQQNAPSADPLAPSAPPAPAQAPVTDAPPAYAPPAYVPPASTAPMNTDPSGQPASQPGAVQPAGTPAYAAPANVPPAPPAPPVGGGAGGYDGTGGSGGQQAPKTNVLAIVSFISAFFISILAIILGHISLSQIKKTGESGRGLALAGTILGYVFSFAWIGVIIAVLVSAALFASNVDSLEQEIQQQLEQLEESGELPEGFLPDEDLNGAPEDYEWDAPWTGTAHEGFCDAWDVYPSSGEEHQYLQDVADAAPDAELQRIWQDIADEWLESANASQEAFDEWWAKYEAADIDADILCYEG